VAPVKNPWDQPSGRGKLGARFAWLPLVNPSGTGFSRITLAHNVSNKEEVPWNPFIPILPSGTLSIQPD
jgi:hypothetical protein